MAGRRWLWIGLFSPLLVAAWLLYDWPTVPLAYVCRTASATDEQALIRFLLQLVAILAVSRLLGRACRWIGQPQVVGEMAAGILLGPTLFGQWAPALSHWLFPAAKLASLSAVSQVGLVLFMFVIGLEMDLRALRETSRSALVVAIGALTLPFACGVALAHFLYPIYGSASGGFHGFALFIGIACSATAFPVLARILRDAGLTRAAVGTMALSSAAVIDIVVWIALSVVVAMINARSDGLPVWGTIGGALIYLAVMLMIVRPGLSWIAHRRAGVAEFTHDWLALVLVLLFCSAIATEWLGIHALFGAFVAGVVMPRSHGQAEGLVERLEDLTLVLFVPIFFVFTGLRTDINALLDVGTWPVVLGVIGVATLAKVVGATLAARLSGVMARDAWALGVLLNTRGLVELVILNIGLDIGVISAPLFTILVLMTIVTTCMTSPILRRLVGRQPVNDA
ncbi:Kef-type K+ transport system membrane component KefB [Chitinivorax tropicus]|uniref:Kef-type K+ transport system membrane component KefB n=1 Tax=Chitinivorax tropicus TaxID=714531 RepID=A0A840MIR4_9PROT|nr:cation:proton antiporter [Chitinivorax tropicus]MBB5017405.1 Kef-type K+ transport system membrane component KefB [Chitinivorax tropicus]